MYVSITGNLVADPKVISGQNGDWTALKVAHTTRSKRSGDWADTGTLFVDARCFNGLGANVAASLVKGQEVTVAGFLEVEDTERDGTKYKNFSMLADEVGVSLRFGKAEFSKTVGASKGAADIVDE
jgi:single-strand DNA-binding protein